MIHVGTRNILMNMYATSSTTNPYRVLKTNMPSSTKIAPAISVQALNQMMQMLITDTNQVVAIFGPEKEELKMPTEEAIKKILKDVKAEKLTPYVDKVSDEPLMKETPKGGKIISEQKDDVFGTTMLTLSNGVKVIIKKTDFKADEITMNGM